MLKFNIRFGWDLKRFYCHGCKELMVPGVNARVRLAGGTVLTTCASCGRVNRKRIAPSLGGNSTDFEANFVKPHSALQGQSPHKRQD